jgi:hypothetical protein
MKSKHSLGRVPQSVRFWVNYMQDLLLDLSLLLLPQPVQGAVCVTLCRTQYEIRIYPNTMRIHNQTEQTVTG